MDMGGTKFIDFAKNRLGYNIQIYSQSKVNNSFDLSEKEQQFRKKYEKFVETLPLQNSGQYAKLYTKARQSPFKLYRNSANGIAIKAFTKQSAPMSTNFQQLQKIVFENADLWYSSYEPIIIERIQNDELINKDEIENEVLESDTLTIKSKNNQIKNIILYGAPGVGKTYNTSRLIDFIEGGLPFDEAFNRLKSEQSDKRLGYYENAKLENRVQFITFHQSFGYEDFIEGFRPSVKGDIELRNGIFKEICKNKRIILSAIFFKITSFKNDLQDNTVDVKKIIREMNNNETLSRYSPVREIKLSGNSIDLILDNQVMIQVSDEEIYDYILEYLFDELEAQSLKISENDSGIYSKILVDFFSEWMKEYHSIDELINISMKIINHETKNKQKNKYLVIDEINRGNISKIFGELITLIEEDKRDNLEVTLPYSKQSFKVPSNLYIIGTMNSTDKSIALIDIALRRRFTFLKMEPNPELVTYPSAKEIMVSLNEKIRETLGSEYVIGHSYFMKVYDDNDLDFILTYKIKPLLEEYFYGDEQGLSEILGLL
jgi:5-methylcytosine-specific restriction protein B